MSTVDRRLTVTVAHASVLSMQSISLPSVQPSSRRESVTQVLRDAIVSGNLIPGQKLVEAEIAAELQTSRAPVREAMRQLEQEGLVISWPYRTSEVLGVSQEEIDHVLVPVRISLEQFAFKKAMERLDDAGLQTLERIIDEMRTAALKRDLDNLVFKDSEFHEKVVRLSQQRHCLQLWSSIQPRVLAYFRRDATYYDDLNNIPEQHDKLLEVLKLKDEEELSKAVADHIKTHFNMKK